MIKIGGHHYDIELSKISSLPSVADFQAKANRESAADEHKSIDLFETALKGIESGYHQCFVHLPAELEYFYPLCGIYELLKPDGLTGQSLKQIFDDLRGKSRTGKKSKETETKACDAAFRFVYLMLMGSLDIKYDARDEQKSLNILNHVMMNQNIFT
ncbi:hypothetical protein NHQ30_006423 [Ciborinia camelliae]|nr:hypothetical protein NHQ30_006423 [Ciborinia camelliae]